MLPQTNGFLAMIKLSLKAMASIAYMLFLFENNLGFFFAAVFMQRDFFNVDIVFGCDDPTNNPSSLQILSLLTQFSGYQLCSP